VPGDERQKGLDKGLGFSRRFVHLPIGGNQRFTWHFVGSSNESRLTAFCKIPVSGGILHQLTDRVISPVVMGRGPLPASRIGSWGKSGFATTTAFDAMAGGAAWELPEAQSRSGYTTEPAAAF
jgi:hypothetical protein